MQNQIEIMEGKSVYCQKKAQKPIDVLGKRGATCNL
jgi:hypothetical protein